MSIEAEIISTPINPIAEDVCVEKNINLFIKREDLCHAVISGNKWHKLRLNLIQAKQQGLTQILSFGGAWSNHIHALAYACSKENLALHAVIRGEELRNCPLNLMLAEAQDYGAQLHFISRSDYRKKTEKTFLLELQKKIGPCYVIPEGGANAYGVQGSELFAIHCLEQFYLLNTHYPNYIVLACGSGTMAAGFIQALAKQQHISTQLVAYAAVKDASLPQKIIELAQSNLQAHKQLLPTEFAKVAWQVKAMQGKGFASVAPEQVMFMQDFQLKHGIPLDPVYTGKLVQQVLLDIQAGYFPKHSSILLIHSGGLQGGRSLSHE